MRYLPDLKGIETKTDNLYEDLISLGLTKGSSGLEQYGGHLFEY